jgi:hypothetical protein
VRGRWDKHGEWLLGRIRGAWARRLFDQEPAAPACAFLEALFTDEDFDEYNDPGRLGVLRELASASARAHTPSAKERQGPRRFVQRRLGVFGPEHMGRVLFLRAFAVFFEKAAEAVGAFEEGAVPVESYAILSSEPWVAQMHEVSCICLFTHPGEESRRILFELAERARIPVSAVTAWCERGHGVDSYMPTATTELGAMQRVCIYVLSALANAAWRETAKETFGLSAQTIARYRAEGHKVETRADALAIAKRKHANKVHGGAKMSEAQVAEELERDRASIQRARRKAVAAGELRVQRESQGKQGTWRYSDADVAVLKRYLSKRPDSRPRRD